jgi:ubiquinone/menaquinone biosynthesis C-methylase UbiE
MSENFATYYDQVSKKYTRKQQSFYKKHFDASRKALYDQIDLPLENKTLLDMGCGFGQDLAHFQKLNAQIFGIDSSSEMIAAAQENYPFLKNLFKENFEKTHFEKDFFDIIISRFTLHYAEDLEKVFKEIHRILKPQGIFIFLVPHPLSTFFFKKKKDYYLSEIIEVSLFDNVKIKEPTHTLNEYFHPFLLENFHVLSLLESPSSFVKETNLPGNLPEFLLLKLQKK